MFAVVPTLMLLHAVLGVTTIDGRVVDANGQAVPHAQVFLEPGMGGEIMDAITDPAGKFQFEDVNSGPAGIFAVAPGFGFEGQHIDIALADVIAPIQLTLHPATEIRGTITDHDGNAVEGARITRIGVKGAHKVGVPLAKLKKFGYAEPQSDGEGHFVLENVPQSTHIDLKIGHSSYAQEGVADVEAGSTDVRIKMYPGVLVEGTVVGRATQNPVAQVVVQIQNAQPPHDTALTQSGIHGTFSMRIKPGVYLYRALGTGLQSAGWQRLTITGERVLEHLRVVVAGTGVIRGRLGDALSGEPIRNVRIFLSTNGVRSSVTRTGPKGEFLFDAGEGENIVRLDVAPGYFPPASQDMKVSLLEGASVELPGMWLKPLPTYNLTILDEAGDPVPGAVVSVLRPAQFGWHVADDQGIVALRIQTFPESGPVLARAEHPTAKQGALFSLEKHQESAGTVKLFPHASVAGRITNSRGRGVGGAIVGAFFPGAEGMDSVLLWQTRSGPEGEFQWDWVIPGVPQRCAVRSGSQDSGESQTYNLAPSESKTIDDISVPGGSDAATLTGMPLTWRDLPLQCGPVLPEDTANKAVLLLYTRGEHAAAVAEAAQRMYGVLGTDTVQIAVVASGPTDCLEGTEVPIYLGHPQSDATTVLLNNAGNVVLETTGLPPVTLLRSMRP